MHADNCMGNELRPEVLFCTDVGSAVQFIPAAAWNILWRPDSSQISSEKKLYAQNGREFGEVGLRSVDLKPIL